MPQIPRKSYPPEFKQETASLVLDQGYTQKAASEAMGVDYTVLDRWVKQLHQERQGETPEKSQAMTTTQREIQVLKVQIRRV
jgi:transposase